MQKMYHIDFFVLTTLIILVSLNQNEASSISNIFDVFNKLEIEKTLNKLKDFNMYIIMWCKLII